MKWDESADENGTVLTDLTVLGQFSGKIRRAKERVR
jgi:hypothetical protein